jgi:hypothetical protein
MGIQDGMPRSDQGITLSTSVWSYVVLPWELRAGSRRTSLQDQLLADDYSAMMKEELEDLVGNG